MKKCAIPILIGFLFLLTGCASQEDLRPKRDCPIEQLLLDQSDYPPNTIIDSVHSPIAEEPLESAGLSAYPMNSWTNQMVIRFFSIANAIAKYEKVQETIFNPNEVVDSWKTPLVLGLDNLSASHYQIACGNVISFGKRCYMIGQYEEYFMFFRADVPGKGLTYEMYRDLILRIDNEMKACLNR